jgi:hypothetical protein
MPVTFDQLDAAGITDWSVGRDVEWAVNKSSFFRTLASHGLQNLIPIVENWAPNHFGELAAKVHSRCPSLVGTFPIQNTLELELTKQFRE